MQRISKYIPSLSFFILSIHFEVHSKCMKVFLLLILRVVLVSNISFYILTVKFVDNKSSFVGVFLPIAYITLLITRIRIVFL